MLSHKGDGKLSLRALWNNCNSSCTWNWLTAASWPSSKRLYVACPSVGYKLALRPRLRLCRVTSPLSWKVPYCSSLPTEECRKWWWVKWPKSKIIPKRFWPGLLCTVYKAFFKVYLMWWPLLTALFNNTRTLKLKAQPTNAFFAAVNQVFGGSSQLTTTAEPRSLSELRTTIWLQRARQQSKAGRSRRTFDWR